MLFVLASGNQGKVVELNEGLSDLNIELKSQKEFNCVSPEETAYGFVENALIKARSISQQTQLPAIADDSGLVIPSLGGQPGIISARFAGPERDDQKNIDKVLEMLTPEHDRQAFFYCALVMVLDERDPTPVIAEGQWYGEIAMTPKGSKGFGYDPIFHLPEYDCTAAELASEEKNRVSHRARALEIFKKDRRLQRYV